MKIRFLKFKNWLLLSVLSALGFGACHSAKEVAQTPKDEPPASRPRNEMAVMYGVPTVDYVVKGKVVDAKGKPVAGAHVVLLSNNIDATADTIYGDSEYVTRFVRNASDTTDANGAFEVRMQDAPHDTERLIVRDIDGAANGNYENELQEVQFDLKNLNGTRNGWYLGSAENNVTVRLKDKK